MIHLQNRYLNIGTSIAYTTSLADTILDAIDFGLYTFTFNLGNSRNLMRKRIDIEDLVVCMSLTTRFPMIVFSNIPNMYNLCGSRKFSAWNGNAAQDEKTIKIIKEIEYELNTLSKFGGNVIVELGSYRDKKLGIQSCINSINKMRFKTGYKLVLMNSLDEFFNVCTTLEDLKKVYNGISKDHKKYVNIGLNLGYLQSNNLYTFSSTDDVDRLFCEFEKLFPTTVLSIIIIDKLIDDNGVLKYTENVLYDLLLQCHHRNISVITYTMKDADLLREIVMNLFS